MNEGLHSDLKIPPEKSLAKDHKKSQSKQHDQFAEAGSGETPADALELASRYLRAGLCADEPLAGGTEKQWARLKKWAAKEGLILPNDYPAPAFSETAEHDVRFDETCVRWFKYTSPGYSGLTVDWDGRDAPHLRMAAPAEYLQRLGLQNSLFADNIKLAGLWEDRAGGGWRIVTSQPHVAGDPPTRTQILDGMKAYGFTPLGRPGPNGAPAFRRVNTIVWDAHPGNFFWRNGVLAPIDLIITELP